MAEHELHLFRRANLEQYSVETLQLIPPTRQEQYEMLLSEISEAGAALNGLYEAIYVAQQRMNVAYNARDIFFGELGAYE